MRGMREVREVRQNTSRIKAPPFPQDLEDAGSAGSESGACECPLLDLNRAGPQHSSWWDSPLMAEVARLAPLTLPPGNPLPIAPNQVRAGVERELRALAEDGRTGPDAERDAIEITRAKIRNSEALAERQADAGRCHGCGGVLDDSLPVVSVLTGKRDTVLILHAGCHGEHSLRIAALVERIMAAAGYGADRREGEAA